MRSGPVAQQDGTSSPGQDALSASQQRLWVLERLHPRNPAHNVFCGLRLTGRLDVQKLGLAWREVVHSYEILRTEFHTVEGVPHSVLLGSCSPLLSNSDLEGTSPEEREHSLSQLAREEARRPFDLSSGPLLRASLWRMTPSEHVFLLVAHRIVCDEASLRVLMRQMALRYEAGPNVETATVQTLMQYREFVSRRSVVSEEQISFWRRRLAGAPASLDLPIDRPRPPEQTFEGASQVFVIGGPLLEQLRNLGKTHGATLFTILFTAFNVLLYRYSRQQDLVVGTAVSGRDDPALADVVGPIENIVALRADLSGGPTFTELLTRVHDIIDEAFSHQDVPFEVLLEQLPLERDLSGNPVFQVAFNRKVASQSVKAAGLTLEPVWFDTESETLDLTVNVAERDKEVEARFSYRTDIFERRTILRMVAHFQTLLQAVVENPEQNVSLLPLLTPAERHQLLVEWNDTAVKYPAGECVHELIEAQVERTPNALAVTYNDQSLTYLELNQQANQLAHYLRDLGVRPDTRVAICIERGFEMIVALLAVMKAGGAYVPLDPAYPIERLRYMLEDSAPAVLLTQGHLHELFRGIRETPPVLDLTDATPGWNNEPESNPDRASIGLTPEHLAYVIYTSGSTGSPKGVMIEHRALCNHIAWQSATFEFRSDDTILQRTALSFDASVWEVWTPLAIGARLFLLPTEAARDTNAIASAIERNNVTIAQFVPSLLQAVIQGLSEGEHFCCRYIFCGGEPLSPALAQEARFLASEGLVNLYGPTEATIDATAWRCPNSPALDRIPIGRPVANTRVYILDEHGQPVPVGVSGELYIGGAGVARGYLNRGELTAQRFLKDPFVQEAGARVYRTGDQARWLPDGTIEFLGRNDDQVKIRGFRIELGEIEARLAEHAEVREVIVIARGDTPGEKQLVAYYTCKEASGQGLGAEVLRTHVAARLPQYMVPAAYVQVESLPLTPNGKVDRKALPLPGEDAYAVRDYEVPQGETEAALAKIWTEVLKVERVGRHDNFFDLGGHSLTAARLVSQVDHMMGRQIPLSALFRGATVESLARLIREREDASDAVVMEIQRGNSSRLPFFAIVPPGEESLGYAMLARHMGPEQTVYKIQGHAPVVGTERPYSKQEMQHLTEEYIAAMRTVQHHGPYCLGGLCDGTHIAEQIVLSLEAQGEEVGLFAIFDTWVMQHSQRRWLWKVDYYRQRLRQMKGMSLTEHLASYKRAAENKVDSLLGAKPARADWRETYWPEGFIPARFRAPVILFKRPKQQFYYINDPQMGWGRRSESGVEIHEIDFHHERILREPHVRQFGETLAECVARVSRRTVQLASPADNQQGPPTVPVQVRQGS